MRRLARKYLLTSDKPWNDHVSMAGSLDPHTDIFTNPKDKRTEDYITGRFG